MCMGCKKAAAAPKNTTQSKPVKPIVRKTNWSVGFGRPKVTVSFGKNK